MVKLQIEIGICIIKINEKFATKQYELNQKYFYGPVQKMIPGKSTIHVSKKFIAQRKPYKILRAFVKSKVVIINLHKLLIKVHSWLKSAPQLLIYACIDRIRKMDGIR